MFFYNLIICFYAFVARLISPFHKKAGQMIKGQAEAYRILREKVDPSASYIWVHAASLGEFEQGRPIIEKIKRDYPQYKILLTFFSPSGYNVRKDYPMADIVCYLPFDKRRNVKRFLSIIQPVKVLFIKYEFWYNYVDQLARRNIPVYMVSSIFRSNQIFFKSYGGLMRKLLKKYTTICVQDYDSQALLYKIGIENVAVCGDTRFDRVVDIKNEAKPIDLIRVFAADAYCRDMKILVAGSSWPTDEEILMPYFQTNEKIKLIIAPHEIHEEHLQSIEAQVGRPCIRYSQASLHTISHYDCVIIDCFGLLSSIYRYGQIAYIGGGFGAGIHNLLEAAVYGIPVIFGPNFKKFREARMLIECGGGYSVFDSQSFNGLMDEFLQYEDVLKATGQKAEDYIVTQTGVVDKVMELLDLRA